MSSALAGTTTVCALYVSRSALSESAARAICPMWMFERRCAAPATTVALTGNVMGCTRVALACDWPTLMGRQDMRTRWHCMSVAHEVLVSVCCPARCRMARVRDESRASVRPWPHLWA